MSKLLILCHPKIIQLNDNEISNHWYSEIINAICKDFDINILSVETTDIRPGGNIATDCFCSLFYKQHENKYDFIISPDAGGLWNTYQEERNFDGFQNLLSGLISMVKDDGLLLIDKFIYSEFRLFTLQFFEEHFQIVTLPPKELLGGTYDKFILIKKSPINEG